MKKKGLLHKTKFCVLIILVLCIQILGSNQIPITSIVKAAESSNEPMLEVVTPVANQFFKTGNLTISGTVFNVIPGLSIKIIDNNIEINNIEVIESAWSIAVEVKEGPHNIDVVLIDSQGETIDTEIINNLTIDTKSPSIEFVNLSNGTIANSIELKTEPNAAVKICLDCTDSENSNGTWINVPKNSEGKWIYWNSQLQNRDYTVYAKSTDLAGNIALTEPITFTLDTIRPVILLDPNVLTYTEDMTHVPVNTDIKFTVSDANGLIASAIENSIIITGNGEPVSGKPQYDQKTNEIVFVLDPEVKSLSYSTKYHVFISPLGVVDKAGNSAFPRFWSFTTESMPPIKDIKSQKEHYEILYNSEDEKIKRETPHTVYANNVNVCINCHSTHEASNPNLLDQKRNADDKQTKLTVDNYCMACHDGTVAPVPENSQATHKHTAAIDISGQPSGSSCASCHNPHLDWSSENPNLLQDHTIYTHASTIKVDGQPVGTISNKEKLCEACHESDGAQTKTGVEYLVFQYKKTFSATGVRENYELCLRCHNAVVEEKNDKVTDIDIYYEYLPNDIAENDLTADEINLRKISASSGHVIKALDGTPLAGHLPCAECHDTHGSNNIKQLKEQLGHEQLGTENKQSFQAKTGGWDALKERSFCLTCHNGETGLYGITVKALPPLPQDSDGKDQTGHNNTSQESCASCHTDSYNKDDRSFDAEAFRESAHAPKKIPK
ncbi:MAG: cytochrome family protein [Pelosinus sp.]|jgi:hypothetical protein|nr:cytochrome family protein [Pelosinus sp.]